MVKMRSNLADLPLDLLADQSPPVLTSCGQDEFKFGRSTLLVVTSHSTDMLKMSSNLADLPLDLLADLPPGTDILWSRWVQIWHLPLVSDNLPPARWQIYPQYWHLLVKMSSNLADLPLDLLADLHPWYWHLVVKMSSNLADLPLDLLTFQSLPVLTSCGQDEFKFGRSTPRSAGRSTPCTDILWSRWFQIWQIYPPGSDTDISWSRWVQIWQIYP